MQFVCQLFFSIKNIKINDDGYNSRKNMTQ